MAPVSLLRSTAYNSFMAELKRMRCFVPAFLCCAVLEASGLMFFFSPSHSLYSFNIHLTVVTCTATVHMSRQNCWAAIHIKHKPHSMAATFLQFIFHR